MRGQGGGLFDPPVTVARAGVLLGDSVIGDFDADGILDVAVGRSQTDAAWLVVLRGLGGGDLDTAVSFPLVSSPGPLLMADLNADGDPDLLVVSPEADSVNVLLGADGVSFTALAPVPVGVSPRGLDVADLDSDGDLDFAVANRESDSVSLRYNDGTGQFVAGAEVPTGPAPQDVELADLEGDGLVDLVVGSNGDPLADTGTLAVLRGSDPATFTEIRTYETLRFVNNVTAADFDRDGYVDFVIGTGNNGAFGFDPQAPGFVSVVSGRPGQVNVVVSQVGKSASDVTVADLDGDSDLDVVSTRGLFFLAIVFNPLG